MPELTQKQEFVIRLNSVRYICSLMPHDSQKYLKVCDELLALYTNTEAMERERCARVFSEKMAWLASTHPHLPTKETYNAIRWPTE